jgi:hypothetical protein
MTRAQLAVWIRALVFVGIAVALFLVAWIRRYL